MTSMYIEEIFRVILKDPEAMRRVESVVKDFIMREAPLTRSEMENPLRSCFTQILPKGELLELWSKLNKHLSEGIINGLVRDGSVSQNDYEKLMELYGYPINKRTSNVALVYSAMMKQFSMSGLDSRLYELMQDTIKGGETAIFYDIANSVKEFSDYPLEAPELKELWGRLMEEYAPDIIRDLHHSRQISGQEFDYLIEKYTITTGATTMNDKNAMQKVMQKVTFIYGTAIKELSKEELMRNIKRAQDDIKTLKETGVKSTYITKEVKKLNKAIKVLIARLDS